MTKDRGKRRTPDTVMGELLVQLAQRTNIQKMLTEMDEASDADVIRELLDEFEKIVDRRHLEKLLSRNISTAKRPSAAATNRKASPPQEPPSRSGEAITAGLHTGEAADVPARKPPVVPPESPKPPAPQRPVPQPIKPPHHPKPEEAKNETGPSVDRELIKALRPPEDGRSIVRHDAHSSKGAISPEDLFPLPPKPQYQRTPYEFAGEDFVYLHGVAMIGPNEKIAAKPFLLEEKGIEDQEFVFAFDYGGLRFYLSKINERTMNVSKTGIFLLSKQDSIRLRGVHESILNGLRAYGILLPFEFGSVALGKADLLSRIEGHLKHIKEALKELSTTTWWNLSVYALDGRIARFARPEGLTARREDEKKRESYDVPTHVGKFDIKTLERILSKEKKIAESIHEEMQKVAERSDIDVMIGIESGFSDDWKIILKASYEIQGPNIQKLNRVLNHLQYQHFVYELMLSLSGNREKYSFKSS